VIVSGLTEADTASQIPPGEVDDSRNASQSSTLRSSVL